MDDGCQSELTDKFSKFLFSSCNLIGWKSLYLTEIDVCLSTVNWLGMMLLQAFKNKFNLYFFCRVQLKIYCMQLKMQGKKLRSLFQDSTLI